MAPLLPRRRVQHRSTLSMVLGIALAVTWMVDGANSNPVIAQSPNACGLLMIAEIQPVAGNTTIADGVSSAIPSVGRLACRYQWGAGTDRYTLDVIVNEASRMPSEMSANAITQRLATAAEPGILIEAIPDVGEAAAFTSDSPFLATTIAYLKGRVVQLNLDGYDARAKKAQVIAMLKTATSRL